MADDDSTWEHAYIGFLVLLAACFSIPPALLYEYNRNKNRKTLSSHSSSPRSWKQVLTDHPVTDSNRSSSSPTGIKVLKDYSVVRIPGDGRCLFRSIAHGACVRAAKCIPDEQLQKQLADELRSCVADEFIKRRTETEWFIQGEHDFETYVARIRNPWVWGGEPELLMASHVLQMPIAVYMDEPRYGGLISVAEYGHQEYGSNDPIRVLFSAYGHYSALHTACTDRVFYHSRL